jgi:hypothetical protein
MIDDMAQLKRAMEQMDAEDPTVAQAAKDRAALILNEARLSFSKLAELIEQRRLLLLPAILARIKRMDQPGMLGDAAFRDTGSALRKEGQSFFQIAEAIELSNAYAPRSPEPAQTSEPFYQMASEPPEAPAWLRALMVVVGIVLFPLRHPLRFLAIGLLAVVLFYALRGVVDVGQQVSGYFNGVAGVRQRADAAMSSVSSFVNEQILRRSKDAPSTSPASIPYPSATTPPTPAAPIPSPSPAASSPPSTVAPAAPVTASAPSAAAPSPSVTVPPAPPAIAPAPPSAAPAGPPASTPRRDARGASPSKSAANCGAPGVDRYSGSRRCAPLEDERPRVLEDVMPEGLRRQSRMAGPCIGGVGGCYWGGGRY